MEMNRTSKPGPGLYIHIPFCLSRCWYCSFLSTPCASPPESYIRSLIKQAENIAGHPLIKDLQFGSMFIGGGTPTVYPGKTLAGLITSCRKLFTFDRGAEISVEANPNTLSGAKLDALLGAGVNRLSIGVQSFSDKFLRKLGRSHSRKEAFNALASARRAGFENISLDLMYGLPGQGTTDLVETIGDAVSLAPTHISLYELTIEQGSSFAQSHDKGQLILPGEDEVLTMARESCEILAEKGYRRYEISNYALPGRECIHNVNCWKNGSYLGLGVGAVSYISGLRIKNIEDQETFAQMVADGSHPFAEAECLPPEVRFRETVIMGLRMLEGVSLVDLENDFGINAERYYGPVLDKLIVDQLVLLSEGFLRLTPKGLELANYVMAELV
ncbi:MAG: radical SAM family heme chaperone HemW [Proteobacteria bacterium]|nr:radical SAM family heme chaperone HemW [Pseudomonadota bacterium]